MNIFEKAINSKENKLSLITDIANNLSLQELFDWQMNVLIEKGYPDIIGISKEHFCSVLLKNCLKEIQEKGEFNKNYDCPFILIVPEIILAIPKKVSLLEVNGKRGLCSFNSFSVFFYPRRDKILGCKQVYSIAGVDFGLKTIDKPPDKIFEKKEDRRGLTLNEGVMLCTYFPEILENHFLVFNETESGLTYADDEIENEINASLWLLQDELAKEDDPELNCPQVCFTDNDPNPEWGTPSCFKIF